MSEPYRRRVKHVAASLGAEQHRAAMLLSSAVTATRSRDTDFPYRQSSDFYYLTGTLHQECALLISREETCLIARRDDARRRLWEGSSEKAEDIAARCGAKLVIADDVAGAAREKLRGFELLYYQNLPGSAAWRVARELIELPSWKRMGYPMRFCHCDAVLETLRLFKDAHEIGLIEEAADITHRALRGVQPLISPGAGEWEIAAALDYGFRVQGGQPAFSSIVAAGSAAAVLHYEKASRVLRRGEMLLIDCGAERSLYAADVTRVYPVSGRFSELQRELYAIVLAAQKAAIARVKDGVAAKSLYDAAAKVLTEGLVELRVLRGKTSALVAKEAFKPYFPHSIGHMLGLDVHDVGRMRGDARMVLRKGMVLTVEPGLYFAKKTGKVPACGVRIEDDVLVTDRGARVLTAAIPKEIEAVEEGMAF